MIKREPKRKSEIKRKTNETDISLTLNLDGTGKYVIDTGVGFLDHMLELFARHGCFDIEVHCAGDTQVDAHHTVEDIAICLGSAVKDALGTARGINRYSDITLPMDEALVLCAVDISGRSHLTLNVVLPTSKTGDFDLELFPEFMEAFARNSGITIHMHLLSGRNSHHIVEACFKALTRALRTAVAIDPEHSEDIPSTKGVLV